MILLKTAKHTLMQGSHTYNSGWVRNVSKTWLCQQSRALLLPMMYRGTSTTTTGGFQLFVYFVAKETDGRTGNTQIDLLTILWASVTESGHWWRSE